MANFLTKLFSAGASSLVEAVGDAIDKNFTSDEERKELENEIAKASMQYDIEMATLGLEEKKAFLADTASARENQTRIQESEHASWLAKNVHSILAVSIIGLTFFMYFWIIQGDMNEIAKSGVKDIVIYILGALTTISTQVAAYFFGSSQGSKDKQKSLDNVAALATKKP
jgi:ABC-type siderophore export system fused ATPase/permease subunit